MLLPFVISCGRFLPVPFEKPTNLSDHFSMIELNWQKKSPNQRLEDGHQIIIRSAATNFQWINRPQQNLGQNPRSIYPPNEWIHILPKGRRKILIFNSAGWWAGRGNAGNPGGYLEIGRNKKRSKRGTQQIFWVYSPRVRNIFSKPLRWVARHQETPTSRKSLMWFQDEKTWDNKGVGKSSNVHKRKHIVVWGTKTKYVIRYPIFELSKSCKSWKTSRHICINSIFLKDG